MQRPLDGLEQIADVVEAQAGSERAEVARPNLEWRLCAALTAASRQSEPQALVDDLLERLAGAPDLGFQADRDVVVEGQSRSHIMMLK